MSHQRHGHLVVLTMIETVLKYKEANKAYFSTGTQGPASEIGLPFV